MCHHHHIPRSVSCPARRYSNEILSFSFFDRIADQIRSVPTSPPSATPRSRNVVQSFFGDICLTPSSSHHLWNVSLRAFREIQPPASKTHSLSRNNPILYPCDQRPEDPALLDPSPGHGHNNEMTIDSKSLIFKKII